MSTPGAAPRPLPPPLEHPLPPCSLCGETVEYDGGHFYCEACGCSWDSDGSHLDGQSSWDNPTLEQCPATVRPYMGSIKYPRLADVVLRCLKSESHAGVHRDLDGGDWTDNDTDGYVTRLFEAEALGIPPA